MKIGYARVSKSDGSQALDLQIDALVNDGVEKSHIYHDYASGKNDERPGLANCLKSLRPDDTLVIWKLDRLGRSLSHLVNTVEGLSKQNIGFKVLTGKGADINTTTAAGKLIFGIFAALSEFERELISERTLAGLKSARARGKKGGRKFSLSKSQILLAQSAMKDPGTNVSDLCKELGISRQTLYRYVAPDGTLRSYGKKIISSSARHDNGTK